MSGESAPKPKPRLVLCPKCWQLLPESPDYDVYKCGGCGTTLQAKKRRSNAVNSESSTHETDAAPRNAVHPKADDKQYNNEEKILRYQENGVRKKLTSSSSRKCSLDGYDRSSQTENGECDREQLGSSRVNGFNEKISSSSGECSSSESCGKDQTEDRECNGKQLITSQGKTSSSSSGEFSLVGNGGRYQIEGGECDVEQPVISQDNGSSENAASSSSRECSLNGNAGSNDIEDGKYNGCSSSESCGKDQTEDRECNGKQLITSQGKTSSSSSGKFSLVGNGGRYQIEGGECNVEQPVIPQDNGSSESCGKDQTEDRECNGKQLITSQGKTSSSSSGEFSLVGNGGRYQIEGGECDVEQPVITQDNGSSENAASSSSRECSLNGNAGSNDIEAGKYNGEQPVVSPESGLSEKAASTSSGECSLNGNGRRNQIGDSKDNGEQPVISQKNGLREKAASSCSGECSLNGNGGGNQIDDDKFNGEQTVNFQENGHMEKASGSSLGECSLDGNDGKDQIENGERNGERIEQFNLPDDQLKTEMDIYKLSATRRQEVSNSGFSDELTHFENEASAELMAECSVENAKNTNLLLEGEELSNGNVPLEGEGEQLIRALAKEVADDEKSASVQVKSVVDIAGNDSQVVQELNNGNLILEGPEQELFSGSDGEAVNNDKLVLFGANPKAVIDGSSKARSEELHDGNLLLEVREEELNVSVLNCEDLKHPQSDLLCAKSEVDNAGNTSTAKRLSTEEGSFSCSYPCELERSTSGNHASSKTIAHSFDSNTFDNTEVINPGFETSGTLGGLSKSSTTRSYHAYDGSVSSNDGVDEQFPNQYLDSFENTYTIANGVFEGGSRKGKDIVNSMLHGDPETLNRSYFRERRPHVPRDSRRNINEVPETTRHDHARWMRDKFPPRMPHHRSGSQSGYESGSTSNQMIDEFYCGSSYLSHDSFDDPDQEKMKLLRLVYKLQDQVNRTSYGIGETNGRLSMGSHISACQSHDLHERRFYHGSDYPRCDGICSHGMNRCQKHNFSRAPYPTEPTCSMHHVDPSCFNCCPQQWQHSAELPPRDLYQHEELCRSNPGHNCCSPHHSYPVSPQWSMTSNLLPHAHETMSCDQLYRPEVKKHFREKPILTRRHYRPVAGGAPFVTCNKCLKLLHLPADFLLFKRVFHQLKCGACQEVLKFSLQNRSHIVSYPSNNLESPNEVIYGSNPPSHADHASFSDDYENSVGKSHSSEGDPMSATLLDPLHGSEYDKPTVSSGTLETIIEKEKTAVRGPGTSKASVETDESTMNSSNIAPEMQAHLQPRSSPLHQLMGYSSPSQVVRGIP